MQKQADFRFYAELNDFLPDKKKSHSFSYAFNGTPAIKDSIEAIGVPHVEVNAILVNGASVNFTYQLQDGDNISVYPVSVNMDILSTTRLQPPPLPDTRFILDVHLGKLTHKLRMLGFDTLYRNDYEDAEIVELSVKENRIILTHDRSILMYKSVAHGYWIRSDQPDEQIVEVLKHFDLYSQVKAFHRCIACNGMLNRMDKQTVEARLEPKTILYYGEFHICSDCNQIYWKGSHYEKMKDYIQNLMSDNDETGKEAT